MQSPHIELWSGGAIGLNRLQPTRVQGRHLPCSDLYNIRTCFDMTRTRRWKRRGLQFATWLCRVVLLYPTVSSHSQVPDQSCTHLFVNKLWNKIKLALCFMEFGQSAEHPRDRADWLYFCSWIQTLSLIQNPQLWASCRLQYYAFFPGV